MMNHLKGSLLIGGLAVIAFMVSYLREKLMGSRVETGYRRDRPFLGPPNKARHFSKIIVAGQAVFTEVY